MQDSNPEGLWNRIDWMPADKPTELSRIKLINLNSTARPYDQRAFSPLDPTAVWHSHLAVAIYMFVFSNRKETSCLPLLSAGFEPRGFLKSNLQPADWMPADKPTELSRIYFTHLWRHRWRHQVTKFTFWNWCFSVNILARASIKSSKYRNANGYPSGIFNFRYNFRQKVKSRELKMSAILKILKYQTQLQYGLRYEKIAPNYAKK